MRRKPQTIHRTPTESMSCNHTLSKHKNPQMRHKGPPVPSPQSPAPPQLTAAPPPSASSRDSPSLSPPSQSTPPTPSSSFTAFAACKLKPSIAIARILSSCCASRIISTRSPSPCATCSSKVEPYPLTAWKRQFKRIRGDLDDALAREETLSPATSGQRRYLALSVTQFWDALDRIF